MIRAMHMNWLERCWMLTLAGALSACGDPQKETPRPSPTPIARPTTQSICLGRFVLQVPGVVEVGAALAQYKSSVQLEGLDDLSSTGTRWRGLQIVETVPTNAEGFAQMLAGLNTELQQALTQYRVDMASNEGKVSTLSTGLGKGNAEEQDYTRQLIEKKQQRIKSARLALELSGPSPLEDPQAFATLQGNTFTVGYLDPLDQRLRSAQGEAPMPTLSPQTSAKQYARFRQLYRARTTSTIPTTSGYCTGHGFITEPAQTPEPDTVLNLPFRSAAWPNLVFILTLQPARADGPRDILQLDNPNLDKLDLTELTGMSSAGTPVPSSAITTRLDPQPINIAGQKGRLLARAYRSKASRNRDGADIGTAYEIEAEALGEPGRIDRPAIKLQLAAALPDHEILNSDAKPHRPSLQGHQPPPFEEGLQLFKDVLKSLQLRPVSTP